MVIVRNVNESKRTPPKQFMARESAEDLYAAGLATWNDKRSVLTLKKKSAEMYKTARSLKPNLRVMEDFVMGKPYAIAIIEKWAA
jgi:hypothetical protein